MKDLFLRMEQLEARRLFSVDVTASPPGPPELSVEQEQVTVEITLAKGTLYLLSVDSPGYDVSRLIGKPL
jgi:hypothetical protein